MSVEVAFPSNLYQAQGILEPTFCSGSQNRIHTLYRLTVLLPDKAREADCAEDSDLLKAIFQGKWRVRVLDELMRGPTRLSELKRAIPECSKKVLIDTLHALTTTKLIQRSEFPTRVKKVEYQLDPACAKEVCRLILSVTARKTSEDARETL